MRKLLLLLTVLFLISSFPALAQDAGEQPAGTAQQGDKDTLFYRTLVRDIETASYTELVEWCRTVGVPVATTVPPPVPPSGPKSIM